MGRPRTLGPTITIRLPVAEHALAAELAKRHGMTVNEYLTARLTAAFRHQLDGPHSHEPAVTRTVTPRWKASMKQ